MSRVAAGTLLAASLLCADLSEATEIRPPAALPSAEPSVLHQTADLLIGRPVAAVRLVTGVAMLPVVFPVSLVLGDPDWSLAVCLEDPLEDLLAPLETP